MVGVQAELLGSRGLSASARLVGMALCGGARFGTSRLSAVTGLARNTVSKALGELEAAGWTVGRLKAGAGSGGSGAQPGGSVPVPWVLLADQELSTRAKLHYGYLLLLPGFSHPSGWFSYGELAAMAQTDPRASRLAVAELVKAEWLIVERTHRLARVYYELTFPGRERALTAVARADWRIENAKHHGEALMREYLSLLVDCEEFQDDAAPGWLINPATEGRLELDRFYPPRVGFEFNGVQHYRATGRYSAAQVQEQQERDRIKREICMARGVTLVVVHPEDLTLAGMQQKVGSLLPLREISRDGLLIDYLGQESEEYRHHMAHLLVGYPPAVG